MNYDYVNKHLSEIFVARMELFTEAMNVLEAQAHLGIKAVQRMAVGMNDIVENTVRTPVGWYLRLGDVGLMWEQCGYIEALHAPEALQDEEGEK